MKERQRLDPTVNYVFWQLVLGMCLLSRKDLLRPVRKARRQDDESLNWEQVKQLACELFVQGKILGSEIVMNDALWIAELPPEKINFKIGRRLANYRAFLMDLWEQKDETGS